MNQSPSRREFLRTMGMAGAVLSVGSFWNGCGDTESPPNIVLIFCDDQGYGDLGTYGATGYTTPHLDRLAAEGLRFTDFYASQAVCSASRASLLTGCYSERVSILGALMPWSEIGLNPEETTLAEMLKGRGYATAAFGKWHLGHHAEFLPLNHGFDEYFGLPYSNDMWPVDFDGNPIKEGAKKNYPPLPLIEGNEAVEYVETLDDQGRLTTRYAEKAVDFIGRNHDRPFFCYLANSMPHVPLGVSDKFRGHSERGLFGDVIEEVDWSVGQVLEALKRHGIEENTLVIYTSDNGPWLNFGNHAGSTGGLREGKGTAFEGGPRVPAIMRWPGHIEAGRVAEGMASTLDVLPTLAAVSGAKLPKNKIDGVNLLPYLTGEADRSPRDVMYFYYGGELRGIRQGPWKRVFEHRTRSYAGVAPGKDGHPGPYAHPTVPAALYHLEEDPSENRDVAAGHPDVVDRLETLAEKARASLGDRLTNRPGSEVRAPGRRGFERASDVKNLAKGAGISLANAPSARYSGLGPETLINGRLGSRDYQDSQWLGFQGEDLDATIDLGSSRQVKAVTAHFLRNQISWIFLPEAVSVAVSEDGESFDTLGEKELKLDADMTPTTEAVKLAVNRRARYIKVMARNIGTCPGWHAGAGGRAWLFCDELVLD